MEFIKELSNLNKAKVCIVGAGAGGLCAIRNFLKFSDKFDIEAFEKTGSVGGTWVYNEKREVDEFGLPIHSSMYEKLRTNIPLHMMEFSDFGSDEKIRQKFVSHKDVLRYLEEYAKDSNAYQYIKFYHLIQNISRDVNCWKVSIKNLKTNEIFTNYYDVVLICNGRYSRPRIPKSVDLSKFKGKILHSHNYRRAEEYKDERIVILGCGPSGLDISIELAECAKEIYTLHLIENNFKDFPDKIKQINDVIEYAENKTVHTVKGQKLENIDTIIFATGYEFDYDFLDDSVGVKLQDNGKLSNIFHHLINSKYTTMCILGIPYHVVPFPMYHQQINWFIQYLLGKIELPSKEEMDRLEEEDYNARIKEGIKDPHKMVGTSIRGLWSYENSFCDQINIPTLNKSKRDCYDCLNKFRTNFSTTYKDLNYIEHNDNDFELK